MAIQFFGQYLLSKGILKPAQLLEAVEYQETNNLKLGEYAVKKGFLKTEAAGRINQLQRTKDVRFGDAAVELGLLTKQQVEEVITAQKNDHIYLGDAVVIKGFAKREVIEKALKGFKEEQAHFAPGRIEIPAEVPLPELNAGFFDLTHKLFLRIGGTESKLGAAQVRSGKISVPAFAVQIAFTGQLNTRYIVAAPKEVAQRMANGILGAGTHSDEELQDVVQEFANIVCGNIVARLAQQGKKVDISPPEAISGGKLDISPDKALVFPLVTPVGECLAAVVF